jgi:hypothetical protein
MNFILIEIAGDLLAPLKEAEVQIDYLHDKFGETGSGNAVLARIREAIAKAEAAGIVARTPVVAE